MRPQDGAPTMVRVQQFGLSNAAPHACRVLRGVLSGTGMVMQQAIKVLFEASQKGRT